MRLPTASCMFGIATVIMLIGCTPASVQKSKGMVSAFPNAGVCNLTLLKESNGYVRLDVRNVTGDDLLICMNFAYPNFIFVELKDPERGWVQVLPVDRNFYYEPKNPGDEDWIVLPKHQGHSKLLQYNDTGRLKVGESVRVTWHCEAVPPKLLKGKGSVFPNHEISAETTVLSD